MSDRAGKYVKQPGGYRVFIPELLPPEPLVKYDAALLSMADRALARLDCIITVLPDPELFILMYIRKEALLSSQIEGTRASLDGVLEYEADLKPKDDPNHAKEVVNYIDALNYGIDELGKLPMSLRLIKEIHRILIEGTRGDRGNIGEFRNSQNFIGPQGASLSEAEFIPPPPSICREAMAKLEEFLHAKTNIPPLVNIALIHAQFETIHPFLDGNGRLGRLLITFYLCWKEILSKPILYLSFYLKRNRAEYYDLLMKVRNKGAWEEWVKFFLTGVAEISEESINTAREIIGLKEDLKNRLYENSISSVHAMRLIDLLFESSLLLVDAKGVTQQLKINKVTANNLIGKLEELGILKEITGKQRYKKYLFTDYFDIIARGTID